MADDKDLFAADEAIARHYARQQEGLPPPVPSTAHLWPLHQRWLREYYPVPVPPEGWVRPIPTFEQWLQAQGLTPQALAGSPDP